MLFTGEHYRRKAAECKQVAEESTKPADKEEWLKIANHWLKLAEAADRLKAGK
jgi:hypothetical protein